MSDMSHFQCTLLGTVEVTRSLRNLESNQRLRMAKICHRAIIKKYTEESDRSWLLGAVYYSRSIDMKMDSKDLVLYNGNYMMCQHSIATISAMVTMEGSDGHLVYIGKCSKANNRRLAVVLSFSSLKNANSMVKQFENIKRQELSGVNSAPGSSPPPIPTAPKPQAQATRPPLPSKPNSSMCQGSTSDNDEEGDNYVNDNEEGETENNCEDDEDYVNHVTKKHADPYENPGPSKKVQPELPPRNKLDTKTNLQSSASIKSKPQSFNSGKGIMQKVFKSKKDKSTTNHAVEDSQNIPNIPESKPKKAEARPLPVLPGAQVSNENQVSNTQSPNRPKSDSSNFSQTTDSDDDVYVNDTFYEKMGLDTNDQEKIYIKTSPKNEESISGTRPITNGVDYLIDNENKYVITVNKLADGKKMFPVEIQPFLGPIEKLPEFHKDLYEALKSNKKSTLKTAEVFIHRKENFKVYHNIIINAIKFEKQLKSDTSENERAKIKELHDSLRQARKRLHFYFMHLEGLLSSASEQERIKIQEAVDILKDYYRTADTGILIKSIQKSPLQLMLYTPLHLHSLIFVSGPQLNNKEYRVLLFEQIIIVALANEDCYEYQLDIRMEVVKVNENSSNPKSLSLLVDYGGVRRKEYYNFRFTDETIKQEWKNKILAIQKRYMEKIRDSTQK